MKRRVAQVLVVISVVLCAVVGRVVTESRQELLEAERQHHRGDVDAAIVHYRRSARWYAPLSPYPGRALDRLAALAHEAEQTADVERSLRAWRAVRGAILSTRSFYTPFEARLRRANERIADLVSTLEPPPIDAGKSRAQVREEHLRLLTENRRPRVGWAALLLIGFAVWIAGALVFFRRGFDEGERLIPSEALRWSLISAAGFGLFVAGMLNA